MYALKNLWNKEPAVISAALIAVVNVAAVFHVVTVSVQQLGVLNTGTVAILALFTRQSVYTQASVDQMQGD